MSMAANVRTVFVTALEARLELVGKPSRRILLGLKLRAVDGLG